MIRKIDLLMNAMDENDWGKALSIAAKFPRLGEHKNDIIRGHEAITMPRFYQQLGLDTDELISNGIEALKARYTHKAA
jgi:hypothetical protein